MGRWMTGARRGRGVLLLWLLAGCDAAPSGVVPDASMLEATPANASSAALVDLELGAQGEQVRDLHAYLRRFGYFPDATLAHDYPRWRPRVSTAPAEEDVFDESTEAAVIALQAQAGLPTSGIVDEDTREVLAMGRCGVPDGVGAISHEPVEKFALNGIVWPAGTPITWRLLNFDDVTMTQARTAIGAAFASWSAQTNLSFTERTSGVADIWIQFAFLDGLDGQARPGSTSKFVITFNSDRTWSVASPTPAGSLDLESIALHEIGHVVGMDHNSTSSSEAMWPFTPTGQKRRLRKDDIAGISALYDTWSLKPGAARDIGAGGNAVWVIGNATQPGGYSIHRWTGSDWTQVPGGATRIAVSAASVPWIVNSDGEIFRRTSSGTWELLPGCATDIGAGAGVWVIGCNSQVFKWDESSFSWLATDGVGSRIAVTSNGIPWVVQSNGNIFERTSSSASSGSWTLRTGCARDIGANNHTWITTCDATPGGTTIAIWQNQPQVLDAKNQERAPLVQRWLTVPGGATQIAVGPLGPWLVNNKLEIFQQHKPGTSGE